MYERYLNKSAFKPKLIATEPLKDTALVVVIPVYNELSVLQPLQALQDCDKTISSVEVILVFNASEDEDEAVIKVNERCKKEAESWYSSLEKPNYILHCIEENELPKKHAGVGLARKIGMDEAVRRFHAINQEEGIIVCFDADSSADANYLKAIEEHFVKHSKTPACSVYFEHPTHSAEFSDAINRGIAFYELHLRYYKNALAYAQLPYAFHTVGSSMAVRASIYCQEGGMNRRKAGEDFYFLQKFIKLGGFTELNTTRVIPSPRTSDRVPFGTGRAILEMMESKRNIEESYNFSSFIALKESFLNVEDWYQNNPVFSEYLIAFMGYENLLSKLNEIRSQSTTVQNFVKRLFHWFDAFQCLKFAHFLRDNYFPQKPLVEEASKLLKTIDIAVEKEDVNSVLEKYRILDRRGGLVL